VHELCFDMCLLDVMMPEIDGFTLASQIVEHKPELPFLFLTAKGQKEDKIKGLQLGADDYIVKPFDVSELILRIQNILKRVQKTIAPIENQLTITIGAYVYDPKNYTIAYKGERHRLTEKEAQLLLFLFKHRNTLVKREAILEEIWGNNDFFSGRSMDVFISRLRKYFSADTSVSITSVRGIGLEFNIK